MTRRTLLTLLPLALAACGAPESDAAPGADPAAGAEELRGSWTRNVATVYVQHGINGKDLGAKEALPVDVQVGDTCALTHFTFRGFAGPLSLPPGSYDVKVRFAAEPPCSGGIAIDAPGVALAAGDNVTILAHLADSVTPSATASVFENDVTIDPFRARVIARHAANFGAVDVAVNGGVAFADVNNGEQGAAPLRPGKTQITITPAGQTSPKVFDRSLWLRPFVVYIATAVGTPGNGTFEVLLQTLPMTRRPERPARVTVVHGINGKDLGAKEALPVDVQVGDRCLLPHFTFRTIAGPVKLAAGTYDVAVKFAADPPCSGAAAISAPGVQLAPGDDVTIVAHLEAGATAKPTATIFANDVSRTYGKARVTARHTANFGPVDVLVNGGVAFPGVKNGQQGSADLPRGTYGIAITPAGFPTPRVFDASLRLKAGRLYTAYAVGTPGNDTFEVLLQERKLDRRWAWGWHHD